MPFGRGGRVKLLEQRRTPSDRVVAKRASALALENAFAERGELLHGHGPKIELFFGRCPGALHAAQGAAPLDGPELALQAR